MQTTTATEPEPADAAPAGSTALESWVDDYLHAAAAVEEAGRAFARVLERMPSPASAADLEVLMKVRKSLYLRPEDEESARRNAEREQREAEERAETQKTDKQRIRELEEKLQRFTDRNHEENHAHV